MRKIFFGLLTAGYFFSGVTFLIQNDGSPVLGCVFVFLAVGNAFVLGMTWDEAYA